MHQFPEPQVLPRRFCSSLRRTLDAKGCVLVGHHVILVLRVDGLMLRRDIDFVVREAVFAEVLEQVGIARSVHVHIGEGAVFVLGQQCQRGVAGLSREPQRA